ncbi:hypothetical protein [Flavivirga sp. 57AJ16]|uniref:DUF2383 domain-containing protein n=1 Tax=Flavivirga sp. 57AJ16 TaxID=3025307 RepID=UPI0023659743|nr:hypothetical protein [Flavivirga sp. 57AJ16]MDD7886625.1 hypothetical protein [Flavivirga sp. 57AJ16]
MKTQIKYLVGMDSLQKMLVLSLHAEASYEQLKTKTNHMDIRDWLTAKQELTTDFILKILTLSQEFEIHPQSPPIKKASLNQIWLNMKLKFISIDNNLIIRKCQKIDKTMLDALNHEIKWGLITTNIHQFYTNYKNKLRSLKPFASENSQTGHSLQSKVYALEHTHNNNSIINAKNYVRH